jgi:hypothetical protein
MFIFHHPCADHFAGAMVVSPLKKHLEALNKDLLSQSKKYATWQIASLAACDHSF